MLSKPINFVRHFSDYEGSQVLIAAPSSPVLFRLTVLETVLFTPCTSCCDKHNDSHIRNMSDECDIVNTCTRLEVFVTTFSVGEYMFTLCTPFISSV